ncbi:MAG: hypothetical protein WC043_01410 [Pseudobdellovibrionaceae bacterium]
MSFMDKIEGKYGAVFPVLMLAVSIVGVLVVGAQDRGPAQKIAAGITERLHLPYKLDDFSTLVAVDAVGARTLVYTVALSDMMGEADFVAFMGRYGAELKKNICANSDTRRMLENDFAITTRYLGPLPSDAPYEISLTSLKDCRAAAGHPQ